MTERQTSSCLVQRIRNSTHPVFFCKNFIARDSNFNKGERRVIARIFASSTGPAHLFMISISLKETESLADARKSEISRATAVASPLYAH